MTTPEVAEDWDYGNPCQDDGHLFDDEGWCEDCDEQDEWADD